MLKNKNLNNLHNLTDSDQEFLKHKKKPLSLLIRAFTILKLALTYFHMGRPHTIIGDDSFHF